jgi:hypothetical protein
LIIPVTGILAGNPKNQPGHWRKYVIGDSTGISNESPGFVDIDGDGRLDILCGDLGVKQMIWLQAPLKQGQTTWNRYSLSAPNFPAAERFAHGLGYADINKDGRKDIITTAGCWRPRLTANNRAGCFMLVTWVKPVPRCMRWT